MGRVACIAALLLICRLATAGVCSWPKSELRLNEFTGSGISQDQFNQALDTVQKSWGAQAQAQGGTIVFKRLWNDSTPNSDTYVDGRNWIINSYGGLARIPGMTTDGYALVACHELGHHLGGAPLYSGDDWASVEGEADYFATLQCAKRFMSPDRIRQASLVLANTLAYLGGEKRPNTNGLDQTVVRTTFEAHPKAQCRLDTYLAGVKCAEQYQPLSKNDPKVGTCFHYSLDLASRPRCWFAP